MNCAQFEELLFESLEAPLGATETEGLRAHALSCTRCRELAALMCGHDDGSCVEVPDDLVAGVLARTTGDSCARAQLLLAERTDGPLGADGELLSIHLGTCAPCARLARTLAQMRHELPALAELEPDERFVADVMAATIGVMAPRPVSLRARARRMWEHAIQRPRFAFEAAYAGALVIFLLFGLPSRSVTDLPARAFDDIRREGTSIQRAASAGLDDVAELTRGRWSDSMRQAAMYFDGSPQAGDSQSRLELDLRSWTGAARELVMEVWDQLLAPFAENLRALWARHPRSS